MCHFSGLYFLLELQQIMCVNFILSFYNKTMERLKDATELSGTSFSAISGGVKSNKIPTGAYIAYTAFLGYGLCDCSVCMNCMTSINPEVFHMQPN